MFGQMLLIALSVFPIVYAIGYFFEMMVLFVIHVSFLILFAIIGKHGLHLQGVVHVRITSTL